jgi:hypothetical protein
VKCLPPQKKPPGKIDKIDDHNYEDDAIEFIMQPFRLEDILVVNKLHEQKRKYKTQKGWNNNGKEKLKKNTPRRVIDPIIFFVEAINHKPYDFPQNNGDNKST